MVAYSNDKIKMHEAVAEKLFRIGNDQVAIRGKCAISAGGFFLPEVYTQTLH